MTETIDYTVADDKIADKIAKLAKLAENAGTDEEAATYRDKVNQLMAKFAIDQARIDAQKAKGQKEILVEERTFVEGSWEAPFHDLITGICRAADIKTLQSKRYPKGKNVFLLGYESDVQQALILNASLQTQAMLALREYAKTDYAPSYFSAAEKYRLRRDFVFAFASAAVAKINEARRAALAEAKAADQEIALRQAVELNEGELPAPVEPGTEMVLASKRERVEEFVAEKYPRLGRARGGNVQRGFGAAYAAGREAGQRANVGTAKGIGAGPRQVR